MNDDNSSQDSNWNLDDNEYKTNHTGQVSDWQVSSLIDDLDDEEEQVVDKTCEQISSTSSDYSNEFTQTVNRYYDNFIVEQFDTYQGSEYGQDEDGNTIWTPTYSTITDYDIADHLDRDVIYGAKPLTDSTGENAARNIVVDIDMPEINITERPFFEPIEEPDYSKKYLYNICTEFFDNQGIPLQSSDSGNFHIYFPTKKPVPFYTLRRFEKALNITVDGNWFEVYPTKGYLRIPLGAGSYPVDRITLDPYVLDPVEKVEYFLYDLKGAVPFVDIYDTFNKSVKLLRMNDRYITGDYETSNYWIKEGKELYRHGLSKGGIRRHNAQLRVNAYLKHQGVDDPDERYRLIYGWIQNKHNCCSTEINAGNYRRVEADIERIAYDGKDYDFSYQPVVDQLKEMDSKSREYRKAYRYLKANPVKKSLLNKYKVSKNDVIYCLAYIIRITNIHKSKTVPIAYSLMRDKLGRANYRAFKLCRQVGWVKKVAKGKPLSGIAAKYELMEDLVMI